VHFCPVAFSAPSPNTDAFATRRPPNFSKIGWLADAIVHNTETHHVRQQNLDSKIHFVIIPPTIIIIAQISIYPWATEPYRNMSIFMVLWWDHSASEGHLDLMSSLRTAIVRYWRLASSQWETPWPILGKAIKKNNGLGHSGDNDIIMKTCLCCIFTQDKRWWIDVGWSGIHQKCLAAQQEKLTTPINLAQPVHYFQNVSPSHFLSSENDFHDSANIFLSVCF